MPPLSARQRQCFFSVKRIWPARNVKGDPNPAACIAKPPAREGFLRRLETPDQGFPVAAMHASAARCLRHARERWNAASLRAFRVWFFKLQAKGRRASFCLGACRTLGVESENGPRRGQFLPDSPPHSAAMGQEDGEKWAAAAHSQPTIPKSDRLLGAADATGSTVVACADRALVRRRISLLASLAAKPRIFATN
ncbi:hypothetical protein IP95_02576 [Extensimonas vulgaris]|uniref:Uncharacterized protein n=2 Tax=Extensimonas vulgaris TaxID=1031594 RepID=A0A369AJL5_9BURK|nr:hypothetical protein DFR45_11246 [Extensimonas vulgaris]TWI35442.1 hypothetical protein IP95_02576 [Extensimonas vulgaris]